MADESLPVYGDGRNIRDWIHVKDHCSALVAVMEKGLSGEAYNIGGEVEVRNIDVVCEILKILGKPESLIKFVKDRPGHDWRYAMNIKKIQDDLGWSPSVTFEEGLMETVTWYQDNADWVDHVISGEYKAYYDRMYGARLEKTS
ncbi:MAG: GDP-mannose 4,6-dehydratase, partial [bacterium]